MVGFRIGAMKATKDGIEMAEALKACFHGRLRHIVGPSAQHLRGALNAVTL